MYLFLVQLLCRLWCSVDCSACLSGAVFFVGSTEKKEASHLLGLKERHQNSDQHSNRIRAPCVASTAVETEEGKTKWPDRQRKENS